MQTSSRPCKTASKLSNSVAQHHNRFALATILAVGLLALARPTVAKIIHTRVNVKIPANSRYHLDLTNDGPTDFTISTLYANGPGPVFNESVDETPSSGNGAEGSPPAELIEGDQIGPSQTFYGGTGTMARSAQSLMGSSLSGNWINKGCCGGSCCDPSISSGYLGLSFQINGETHYGWARLTVSLRTKKDQTNQVLVTLVNYAYETTANMPINAGQTTDSEDNSALSPDAALPAASITNPTQAVALGTLALGAQEVPLWRRKESAGSAPENS
jgi:hypothetical protein